MDGLSSLIQMRLRMEFLELLNSDAQTKFETSLKGEIVRENLEVGNYIKLFIEMD